MLKIREKRIVLCFLLVVIMLMLISCTAKEVQKGKVNDKSTQELIVAFGQDIVTFDTHNYRGVQDIIAAGMVYETLVEYDQNNVIVPALAESWEWLNPNELQLNLRKGVKFHDGKDFNADCVKFSIERNNQGSGASYTDFITEVRIIDDFTVIFYMETPYGPALDLLCDPIVSMMSPEWVSEVGNKIVEKANGTGPFKLEEFQPGSKAVFVKNTEYWGNEVALDRIEFRPIPETGTRVMALKSGEVDVIENPPPQEVASIESDPNLYMYTSPKTRTLFLGFNLNDKNVGGDENKALREAIAYSINTEELAEGVLEGLAIATNGDFYPPAISKGLSDLSYVRNYDLEKAKQIVAENGLEGRKVELWCTRGRYLLDSETAEVIQAQIAKIGIDANITVMEYGPMMTAVTEFQQEMFQLAWGWGSGDASAALNQLFSSDSPFNSFAFMNEEFDNLVKEGASYPDLEDRMERYNKALKMVMGDEAALVPLVHYMNIYAANNKVKGIYANPNEILMLKYAYVE